MKTSSPEPDPQPEPAIPIPVRPTDTGFVDNRDLAALERFASLIRRAREEGCSDLHLSPGRSPFVRRFGELQYWEDEKPLKPEEAEGLNLSALTAKEYRQALLQRQLDFAFTLKGIGRQRGNIYRQRLGWEGAFRLIPDQIASLDQLGLPSTLQTLAEHRQGLILVSGPHGSGKTTTVAALLNHINEIRPDHIITLEDPVEYVLEPKKSHITQREVGRDTMGFSQALRAALREDPDVILVGELRDVETISVAATAAETGHLVIGTLHTGSAVRSVTQIIDSYPPELRSQISAMISKSVRGVICQQLVPRADGAGMVLALEILVFTGAIAMMIQEGKTHQIVSAMQSGRRLGMQLMDESLKELLQSGAISRDEALARAENKQWLEAGGMGGHG